MQNMTMSVAVRKSSAAANEAARVWCAEVNAVVHSEIAAIPAKGIVENLVGYAKRDLLV
jgi:hypothetical protein